MKRNSTFVCIVMFLITIITSTSAFSQCRPPSMNFANPVLISGTDRQEDAVYKFSSIMNGVDAYISIKKIVAGASLTSIDDNTFGYSAAWQPVVRTPNSTGVTESYVSFSIEFKDSADGQSHKHNCAQISFIDVDGDNQHVREFVASNDYSSYSVSNVTTLAISQEDGLLKAEGPISNFPGIDTAAYVTNINYSYLDKDKIQEIRIGNITENGYTVQDRYTCAYFRKIDMPNFVVLPVNYLTFNAALSNKSVLLKWQTNNEINNYFEVERSFNGSSFSSIATVSEGLLNGNFKNFQTLDNSSELEGKTISYYRLKQIDKYGKISYSNSLAVQLKSRSGIEMETAPNPFSEKLYARFTSEQKGNGEIRIVNMAGLTVLSKQTTINIGYNNLQLDGLSGIPSGIYVARLLMNGAVIENRKIIKK